MVVHTKVRCDVCGVQVYGTREARRDHAKKHDETVTFSEVHGR